MVNNLNELAKLIRYYSLVSTTAAGSGHPSSALSAADLMTVLFFGPSSVGSSNAQTTRAEAGGFYRFDLEKPDYPNNDRLIFSKGHASPLFYSLYAVAGQNPHPNPLPKGEGKIKRAMEPEELLTLRKFGSRLEGHPTMQFPYTEVPTGSLGQGLSVGVGMALNAKLDGLSYRTYVLLGDSEMAEGSVWEAMAAASHYKLNNLVAILDVNRLGQSRETMLGHNVEVYQMRAKSFGWETIVVDGHNIEEISAAFSKATAGNVVAPVMIIARTLKGKGVSSMEDKPGKHGVALKPDELAKAVEELGAIDKSLVGEVAKPESENRRIGESESRVVKFTDYPKDKAVATRRAYGNALVNIFPEFPNMVVLDGETSNSTFAETFAKVHPEQYIESFIAEQNMVGMAIGLARRGKIPFVSTFAAFFSRAFDQIRMSQYAHSNIKFVGSHAGVSIGEDGSSQMGLEEIAMFRTLLGSVVLYPSDAVSTEKLIYEAAKHQGNVYIQTTRKDTAILYSSADEFLIGGSNTLKSSSDDKITVIGAGITLHEALAAYEELKKEGINIRVIDLYSIKPLDIETLQKAAKETGVLVTVEDHFAAGGIGEAVAAALCTFEVHHILENLSVRKEPHSSKPEELLAYEEIDKDAIIKKVKELI